MKIPAIIQARMGSKRCPKKTLKKIQNKTVIEIVIKRLSKAKNLSHIIVAIPNTKKDLALKKFLIQKKIKFFSGSENNLVDRFACTIDHYSLNHFSHFIRVTADNVFIDHNEIDRIINYSVKKKLIFCSHINSEFPDRNNDFSGEVYNIKMFKKINLMKLSSFDREHVYPYFFRSKSKKIKRLQVKKNLISNIKFDLDFKDDLIFFQKIGKKYKKSIFNISNQELIKLGKKIKKNV
jgi:spore coat polysaccharide biosynthesis protein SpsF